MLELSYVELIHPKEKSLVINILKEGIHNAKIIESINSRISIPKSKSYKHFLLTLDYLCTDDESIITSESGEIFIELYNWHLAGYDYFEELITIAKQHHIPVSFIEKLLSLKTTSSNHKELQTELALNSIAKYKSFGIFKWLLTHQEEKWEVYRNQILDDLKNNNDHYTLIRILIHEQSEEELFTYLKDIREIKIYHRFLPDLIKLSETQTFNIYTDWIDEYMSDHFGEMAVIELDSQLKNVQQIDFKLKKKLDKYVLKKYGERPSLST